MADNFELELNAFEATLAMTCPVCGQKRTEPVARIHKGTKIVCASEDYTWEFTDDDLSSVQRSLDSIKRALKGFGKGF
jgi:hypothetical protein